MADMYKGSGTEPLGSDPKGLSGAQTSPPSGGGKSMGGTENMRADHKVLMGEAKKSGSGSGTKYWPAGVDSFTDGKV